MCVRDYVRCLGAQVGSGLISYALFSNCTQILPVKLKQDTLAYDITMSL